MLASSILRSPTMLRQPASMAARTAFKPMPLSKRYQQLDNRGGKSKLVCTIAIYDVNLSGKLIFDDLRSSELVSRVSHLPY